MFSAEAQAQAQAQAQSQGETPSTSAENTDTPMEVDQDDKEKPKKSEETSKEIPESLPSLSEQLQLDYLWQTLSSCLKDLEDTPDHHAVLVV